VTKQSGTAGMTEDWRPKLVELPNDLSKALLTALQSAVASEKASVIENGQQTAKVGDVRSNWRSRRHVPQPEPEAEAASIAMSTSASSAAVANPGQANGKHEFGVGANVLYWSATHKKWLKACVLSLNDDDGCTYNLDLKAKVGPSQLKRADDPDDQIESPDTAGESKFSVGMYVQCWNFPKQQWQEGTVSRRYKHDGMTVFDVDCKNSVLRTLPASRLRAARFAVGDQVEYWSSSAQQWLSAKVLKIVLAKQTCDLDIKMRAPLANVRKVEEPAKPAETKGEQQGDVDAAPAKEDAEAASEAKEAKVEVDLEEEEEEELEDDVVAELGQDWQDQVYAALDQEGAVEGKGKDASPARKKKDSPGRQKKRRHDKDGRNGKLGSDEKRRSKTSSPKRRARQSSRGRGGSKEKLPPNEARRGRSRSRGRRDSSRVPLRRAPVLVPRAAAGSRHGGDRWNPNRPPDPRPESYDEDRRSRNVRPQEREGRGRPGRDSERPGAYEKRYDNGHARPRDYREQTDGRNRRDFRDDPSTKRVPVIPSRQGHHWSDRR